MSAPDFDPARKEAFRWALVGVRVPHRARLTGLALAHYMDASTGQAQVGQRTLKATFGISAVRLRADVAVLVEAGVLRVIERRAAHGADIHMSAARFVNRGSEISLDDGRILPAGFSLVEE